MLQASGLCVGITPAQTGRRSRLEVQISGHLVEAEGRLRVQDELGREEGLGQPQGTQRERGGERACKGD